VAYGKRFRAAGRVFLFIVIDEYGERRREIVRVTGRFVFIESAKNIQNERDGNFRPVGIFRSFLIAHNEPDWERVRTRYQHVAGCAAGTRVAHGMACVYDEINRVDTFFAANLDSYENERLLYRKPFIGARRLRVQINRRTFCRTRAFPAKTRTAKSPQRRRIYYP